MSWDWGLGCKVWYCAVVVPDVLSGCHRSCKDLASQNKSSGTQNNVHIFHIMSFYLSRCTITVPGEVMSVVVAYFWGLQKLSQSLPIAICFMPALCNLFQIFRTIPHSWESKETTILSENWKKNSFQLTGSLMLASICFAHGVIVVIQFHITLFVPPLAWPNPIALSLSSCQEEANSGFWAPPAMQRWMFSSISRFAHLCPTYRKDSKNHSVVVSGIVVESYLISEMRKHSAPV